MSEDNKSEKSSKDSIMDNDARNCIFSQFKSPSQNSNDDDVQFIKEGSPLPESEATENEKNDSKNESNVDINECSKVMNSKISKKEKKLITDNGESHTKFTKEKKLITDNGELITKLTTKDEEREDNLIDKCWRAFFTTIISLCNILCGKYYLTLKKTNFKQIFGCSFEQNKAFLQLKLYKYFTYNTAFKDNKSHEKTGTYNEKIIKKMIQKDKAFKAIMKCKIEYLFEKYINNDRNITIDNDEYNFPGFKTLEDVIKEKRDQLEENPNNLSADEIKEEEKKLENFEKKTNSLINHILVEGKQKQRKKEINKIEFIIIEELEN